MDTPTPQAAGTPCTRGRRHGFRFGKALTVIAIAAAAGFAGGYAGKSFAQGFGQRGAMSAALDPAQMDERVERMVRHFAVAVDASPEQKDRLAAIARDVARDMAPLREKMRAARKEGIALMAAPAVDRAALERLRAEQVGLADASSRRVTQALADAAEVLTPEQRQKLAERAQRFGERRGWHRG
ncbi:MAG: Spy/CpxP family protein refolding chaperone [Burkholderiales bacterium]|nr:Spy/CpxP family protein refolding chaperone [Burkholderiales bacterium]